MVSERGDLSAFADEFLLESETISRYRKAKRLSRLFRIPAWLARGLVYLFAFGFVITVGSGILEVLMGYVPFVEYQMEGLEPIDYVRNAVILVSLYGGDRLLSRIANRFQNHAEETGITSSDDVAFHYLAAAIRASEQEDFEAALDNLQKFDDTGHSNVSFDRSVATVSDYLDKVEEKEDGERQDYVRETFGDVAELCIEEAREAVGERNRRLRAIVEDNPARFLDTEEASSTPTEEVTYRGILRSIYDDVNRTFAVNFWALYVLAAAAGLGVFFYVDSTLGIVVVTVLLTGIQLYDRRTDAR